ncbi:MAG: hypothetical protein KDL87_13260, partial [Verrucomicrobiae bacterium]|nr:hypothetical protein [Verrucomicrobiae bacterium]
SNEASLDWDHLTTNLIASRARADREELWLFLVPRNAHINRSHGTDSHVASLEIAGELVMSDPKARDRIQSGKISHRSAWETIASCQDTGSRRLLERVFSGKP